MRYRHVILDRDGVLNAEARANGYVTSPEQWRWLPGAVEAVVLLHQVGIRVSVATNQSGVGRGLMTAADLDALHAFMCGEIERAGGLVAAVYTCTHAPEEGCDCRKPAPGLVRRAVSDSGIPPAATLVVGDDVRDLEAAHAAGVDAALVLTGKGHNAIARLPRESTAVYDDLRTLTLSLFGPV